MKITADTNILVRAFTGDHIKQSEAAKAALERAELVAISI
jgi:predicted nucleic acid-binding protein